jgi:hypothetical protein
MSPTACNDVIAKTVAISLMTRRPTTRPSLPQFAFVPDPGVVTRARLRIHFE